MERWKEMTVKLDDIKNGDYILKTIDNDGEIFEYGSFSECLFSVLKNGEFSDLLIQLKTCTFLVDGVITLRNCEIIGEVYIDIPDIITIKMEHGSLTINIPKGDIDILYGKDDEQPLILKYKSFDKSFLVGGINQLFPQEHSFITIIKMLLLSSWEKLIKEDY
jgi:hypothetical protein